MTRLLSNIILIFIGIVPIVKTIQATEYTNLKQALNHPKEVTVLKLDIHGVSKKYQNKVFPIGIGKMSNLERIEINTTTFIGFPSEIANCKELNTIILMGKFNLPNELATLPLDSLKWNISKEKVNNIPEAIYSIKSLKYLGISHQNITEISDKFNQLKNLEYLDFSNNQISTIAENFGKLENLKYLYLQNNRITKLPSGLKSTVLLTELNLNSNRLTALPAFSFELPALVQFHYKNNPVSAESLLEIAEKNSEKFHIYCSVDGETNTSIKEIIKNPSNIIMLSIHGKENASIFMKNIDKFYSLVHLKISGDVTFTYEIENLVNAFRLRKMDYAPLNGKIPAAFSKVKQIESFHVDLGDYSKVMPLVLLEMTQLKNLNFSAFNLETIPSDISKLTELESLTITGKFKTIPDSIDSMTKLNSLNIKSEFISLIR